MHAEAVLLVDDRERQILVRHRLLKQRVCADHERDRAVGQPAQSAGSCASLDRAGEQRGRNGAEPRQRAVMLLGQHLCRRHQRRLSARLDRAEHGQHGDQRLARANVALQQPEHPAWSSEVPFDLGERHRLRGRRCVAEPGEGLRLQRAVSPQGAPRTRAHSPAHECQPDLSGQQFVVGETAAG